MAHFPTDLTTEVLNVHLRDNKVSSLGWSTSLKVFDVKSFLYSWKWVCAPWLYIVSNGLLSLKTERSLSFLQRVNALTCLTI